MASALKHVVLRDGVFQYHRRVPTSVLRNPDGYSREFGNRPLYRKSLQTKDETRALIGAVAERQEFNDRVERALGKAWPVAPFTPTASRTPALLAPMDVVAAEPLAPCATVKDVCYADGPRLRDIVSRYLADRTLAAKTVTEVKLALRTFEQVIGDKPVGEINPSDFKRFVFHQAHQTIGAKTGISRKRGQQTIEKQLSLLRSAIRHTINRSIDDDPFSGINPAAGVNVSTFAVEPNKEEMPDKRPIEIGEANLLLRHPWFSGCKSPSLPLTPGHHRLDGTEYWAIVMALYTGCRAAELGGLKLDEIILDDLHPHLIIRTNEYRGTKTGYARRVPILSALMKLGFSFYVERIRLCGNDRLFPDWKPSLTNGVFVRDNARWSNAAQIRTFNRSIVPTSLKGRLVAGARREITFHSFRGAFKTMLSDGYGLDPDLINSVVGHSLTGENRSYHGWSIDRTYKAIKDCDYHGLIVPKSADLVLHEAREADRLREERRIASQPIDYRDMMGEF